MFLLKTKLIANITYPGCKNMDKYDRDVWHDAETMPLWLIVLLGVVLILGLIWTA